MVEEIITGVWYTATPSNTEMKELYPDVEEVQITRKTTDECCVRIYKRDCSEKVVYTGTRGACENWTLLTFDLENNPYCLRNALIKDVEELKKSGEPHSIDLAERITAASNYIQEVDNEYEFTLDLEGYYKERIKLGENRVKDLTKDTSPEDRKVYWETHEAIEELNKKYAKLLGIQAKQPYGAVSFTEDFGKEIDAGLFNDFDGSACFMDKYGNEGPSVSLCQNGWQIKDMEKYPYIIFYGK